MWIKWNKNTFLICQESMIEEEEEEEEQDSQSLTDTREERERTIKLLLLMNLFSIWCMFLVYLSVLINRVTRIVGLEEKSMLSRPISEGGATKKRFQNTDKRIASRQGRRKGQSSWTQSVHTSHSFASNSHTNVVCKTKWNRCWYFLPLHFLYHCSFHHTTKVVSFRATDDESWL